MRRYINSDVAVEKKGFFNSGEHIGSEYFEEERGICTVCRLNVEGEELAQKYGRKEGRYVTVFFEDLSLMHKSDFLLLANNLAREMESMILAVCNKRIEDCSVFVVGLGNASLSVDAVGPFTVEKLTVTRHIGVNFEIGCLVSAMAPGVLSRTGIETAELIRAAAENIKPDVIIAVDSLSAASCERLGTTVQLFDGGIVPGSGIGNKRKAINKESIGYPVISIGVPTVVSSSTLIIDALEKAGVSEIPEALIDVLRDGKSFFVAPRECDIIVESASDLIANALNIVFGTYS